MSILQSSGTLDFTPIALSVLPCKEPDSLVPRPPVGYTRGSGEYSTQSHHGLAFAFEVACRASVNWKCDK